MVRSTRGKFEVSLAPKNVFVTSSGAFSVRINPEVTRPKEASWGYTVSRYITVVRFPAWFPALISSILFVVPVAGFVRRFSLRALLIATTLIAVGLGLIVWLTR
jgi:hypothetical protein